MKQKKSLWEKCYLAIGHLAAIFSNLPSTKAHTISDHSPCNIKNSSTYQDILRYCPPNEINERIEAMKICWSSTSTKHCHGGYEVTAIEASETHSARFGFSIPDNTDRFRSYDGTVYCFKQLPTVSDWYDPPLELTPQRQQQSPLKIKFIGSGYLVANNAISQADLENIYPSMKAEASHTIAKKYFKQHPEFMPASVREKYEYHWDDLERIYAEQQETTPEVSRTSCNP